MLLCLLNGKNDSIHRAQSLFLWHDIMKIMKCTDVARNTENIAHHDLI